MANRLISFGPRALASDRSGSVAVEYAIVMGVLLVLSIALIEFSLALWQWNSAEKATELGVRYAVQSDPVVAGFAGDGWNGVIDGNFEPGTSLDKSKVGAFTITCEADPTLSCVASSGTVPNGFSTAHDGAAFTEIVKHMSGMFFRIQPTNVVVEYAHVGMGFAGRPGADLVPVVTVKLRNITFDLMVLNFLRPLLFAGAQSSTSNGILMPPFIATLSGEDMNSAGAS